MQAMNILVPPQPSRASTTQEDTKFPGCPYAPTDRRCILNTAVTYRVLCFVPGHKSCLPASVFQCRCPQKRRLSSLTNLARSASYTCPPALLRSGTPPYRLPMMGFPPCRYRSGTPLEGGIVCEVTGPVGWYKAPLLGGEIRKSVGGASPWPLRAGLPTTSAHTNPHADA